MRGIGCLLTGIELFPGNIQGGSRHAGRLGQRASRSTRRSRTTCRSDPATRTRFGSLEFGVMVPDRADTWTRMVYAGPNKPIAPIDDPYQMFAKLYGRVKDQESLKSVLDDLQDDLKKVGAAVSAEDRQLLDEHATFVREMEQELQAADGAGRRPRGPGAGAGREGGERQHPADQQDADRPDGQQLRRRLRPRRDAAVSPTRSAGAGCAGSASTKGTTSCRTSRTATTKSQEKLTKINKWYCEQLAYLAKRLAETPEPGGGGSLLDNTLIVWTNELGKGNSHTLDNIPFVLVGNGLDFKMGRSLKYQKRAAQPAAAVAGPRLRATASSASATPTSAATGRCRT